MSVLNPWRTGAIVATGVALAIAGCGGGSSGGGSTTGAKSDGAGGGAAVERGGIALVAMNQEAGLMSPFFNDQSGSDLSYAFVIEPLLETMADGSVEPVLAAEVPTIDNGGVSKDGKTVTYTLRDGITWSDGEPLTAEDLEFTFDVYRDPDSETAADPEYELVTSVKAVDDLTVRVKLSEPTPAYLRLFRQILPEHAFDGTAVTSRHEQARLPLGTGPFAYDSWENGNQIELVRNEHYWRDPEQPYLDGVTVKITPDARAALSAFTNGDYDTIYFITSSDLPDLERARGRGEPIEIELREDPLWTEFLWFNHADPADPGRPHPVLGDAAIREAIDYGIDRQSIIDDVLEGFGMPVGSFLAAGFGATEIEPTPFDPDHAREVLDAAGWKPGADGIRVKDGVRAKLRLQTIAGDEVRERYEQIIQQNLEDVGIEIEIRNVPSNTLFATYDDGGLLATGDYDIVMSRDGGWPDPTAWMSAFHSETIPSAEQPAEFNYVHRRDPVFDRLADRAATTIDPAEREALYEKLARHFAEERISLPLYAADWGWAWRSNLRGVTTDAWDGMWTATGSAGWWLER